MKNRTHLDRLYLNEDWYFAPEFREEMLSPGYSAEQGEAVRLPHTTKEVPLHYFDEHAYQMISSYSRKLNVPADWKGKDILLTFEGVGHSFTLYVNGREAGSHNCGYTAKTINLKDYVEYGAENTLLVKVNSREDQNIPPFGFVVDYMTFGGIYRDVYLEVKEPAHFTDIFIYAGYTGKVRIKVSTTGEAAGMDILVRIGEEELGREKAKGCQLLKYHYENPELWTPEDPRLYDFTLQLKSGEEVLDETTYHIGFRTAVFRANGFYLNGRKYKIRGLDRHQSYPYVGYAMPENPQVSDAVILKNELGCNAVRTSHYPQSHYFLDACDRLGLLVFTELPGWQHIGDEEWKDVAVENVKDMVLQYRNHTSIILWGVRINESVDDDEFYERTNRAARELDPTRQTGGVRCYKKSNLLEDVYTYNDFVHSGGNAGCEKKSDVTSDMKKAYLVSEYMGHMFPTKAFDWEEKRLEHAVRHARVLNDVAKYEDIAGSFGWCMFDYNTHKDFGSGDRICYHGVMDMFRNPKMAAFVYAAMQEKEPVLEISSSMDIGEHPGCNRGETYIFTNADSVKMFRNDSFIKEYTHDRKEFPFLKNPPIRIDDYIGDALEKNENMKPAQAKEVKAILNEVAKVGLYRMSASAKVKAAKMMLFHHMKPEDATALYNKYIGDWGGAVTTYRFEAYRDGKLVKTLSIGPMTERRIEIRADHTDLTEKVSYDVACIRIRAVDENGNTLCYDNDPIILETEGAVKLIGPNVTGLSGGMTGTYIKTDGKSGSAKLTVKDVYGKTLGEMHFTVKGKE